MGSSNGPSDDTETAVDKSVIWECEVCGCWFYSREEAEAAERWHAENDDRKEAR